MTGLFHFILAILASPLKSKLRLEAENAMLRHQLIILRRRVHGRVRLTNHDRWFFIRLYRWFPSTLKVLGIVRPETLLRWHKAGFGRYWRWKSRRRGGRPQIETEYWADFIVNTFGSRFSVHTTVASLIETCKLNDIDPLA